MRDLSLCETESELVHYLFSSCPAVATVHTRDGDDGEEVDFMSIEDFVNGNLQAKILFASC